MRGVQAERGDSEFRMVNGLLQREAKSESWRKVWDPGRWFWFAFKVGAVAACLPARGPT